MTEQPTEKPTERISSRVTDSENVALEIWCAKNKMTKQAAIAEAIRLLVKDELKSRAVTSETAVKLQAHSGTNPVAETSVKTVPYESHGRRDDLSESGPDHAKRMGEFRTAEKGAKRHAAQLEKPGEPVEEKKKRDR
jgi:hypothetical protein